MSSSEIPILNNSDINANKEKSVLKKNSTSLEIDNQNNNNNINMLNESESNNNKLMSSNEWINYFKQSNINLEEINNALLSNVESIDNENIKLKEAK
jgi:hypothetical protein